MTKRKSPILDAVHETAQGLHETGVMDKTTLREFDALCLPAVRQFTGKEIKRLRERCQVSQPVFAAYLNTSPSTVRQWEHGEKHPRGATLRLLDLIERKGLESIV